MRKNSTMIVPKTINVGPYGFMAHKFLSKSSQESDVINILVLQNWLERIRKEVTNKVLSIKRISEFLNFPILAQPTLKKI